MLKRVMPGSPPKTATCIPRCGAVCFILNLWPAFSAALRLLGTLCGTGHASQKERVNTSLEPLVPGYPSPTSLQDNVAWHSERPTGTPAEHFVSISAFPDQRREMEHQDANITSHSHLKAASQLAGLNAEPSTRHPQKTLAGKGPIHRSESNVQPPESLALVVLGASSDEIPHICNSLLEICHVIKPHDIAQVWTDLPMIPVTVFVNFLLPIYPSPYNCVTRVEVLSVATLDKTNGRQVLVPYQGPLEDANRWVDYGLRENQDETGRPSPEVPCTAAAHVLPVGRLSELTSEILSFTESRKATDEYCLPEAPHNRSSTGSDCNGDSGYCTILHCKHLSNWKLITLLILIRQAAS